MLYKSAVGTKDRAALLVQHGLDRAEKKFDRRVCMIWIFLR